MAFILSTPYLRFDPNNYTPVTLDPNVYTGPAYRYFMGLTWYDQAPIPSGLYLLNPDITGAPDQRINSGAFLIDFSDNIAPVKLQGWKFGDTLRGGAGDDTLDGGQNIYTSFAGHGDVLEGGPGGDRLKGGGGRNMASYWHADAGVTVDFADPSLNTGDAAGDSYSNIQGAIGSAFADSLVGDGSRKLLEGRQGADTIVGGPGDFASYVHSRRGVTIDLSTHELSRGDARGDTLIGIENLVGTSHSDVLIGDDAANILNGYRGFDSLFGNGGNDRLLVASTPAIVDGGAGLDTLVMRDNASLILTDNNFKNIERVVVKAGGHLDMSAVTPAAGTREVITSTGDEVFARPVSIVGTAFGDSVQIGLPETTVDAGPGDDILTILKWDVTFRYTVAGFGHDTIVDRSGGIQVFGHSTFDVAGIASSVADLHFLSVNGGADTLVYGNQGRSDTIRLVGLPTSEVPLIQSHFTFTP